MSNNIIIEKTKSPVDDIRQAEFEIVFKKIHLNTKDKTVLEIGSGSGVQLELLAKKFMVAKGIDIDNESFAPYRSRDIIIYDGITFPFNDQTFDFIFSSNTLEHISDLQNFDAESKRVLKENGICIHILPSHYWRLWSIVVQYLILPIIILRRFKKFLKIVDRENKQAEISVVRSNKKNRLVREIGNFIFPGKHGEQGNRFTEYFYFKPQSWLSFFRKYNWEIIDYFPLKIIYSGHSIFGGKLPVTTRMKIAKFLGSACFCYVIKKK
jgi:SAM-dependent methyltransferase